MEIRIKWMSKKTNMEMVAMVDFVVPTVKMIAKKNQMRRKIPLAFWNWSGWMFA